MLQDFLESLITAENLSKLESLLYLFLELFVLTLELSLKFLDLLRRVGISNSDTKMIGK